MPAIVAQAQARVDTAAHELNAARAAAQERIASTPTYVKAKAEVDQLEAAARKLRETGGDRQILAAMSIKWIEAKGRLKKIDDQVNTDPAVVAETAKYAKAKADLATAQRVPR